MCPSVWKSKPEMAIPKKRSSRTLVTAGDKQSLARPKDSARKKDLSSELWLCLVLGLLTLVFYANSFTAGLLFDSDTIIRLDPRLRGLHWANIEQILTHDYWWPSDASVLYRPLTTFSYLFNYTILGNAEDAGGYHLVAETTLEDLAGNSIGRPFEVDVFRPIQREVKVQHVQLPFTVPAAGR